MFQPSPQQLAIFERIREGLRNLMIRARAGCGKTTTITHGTEYVPSSERIALLAYNKSIAAELSTRMAGNPCVEANTFHSFGFRALKRAVKGIKQVNGRKLDQLMVGANVPEMLQPFVKQLVSLGKQRAVGVLTTPADEGAWYDIVEHFALQESIQNPGYDVTDLIIEGISFAKTVFAVNLAEIQSGNIDFDDMIYGPLALDVPMFQFDRIFVDEAQDTNPARRALARKMLKPAGLSVWVGDEHQAIYGFTGADNDAMDVVAREFNTLDLPLSVTYRCPKAVVKVANQWVPDISADASAPEGRVDVITDGDFAKLGRTLLTQDDAVLCRLTKPLVVIAYDFIRRGIPCHIEGRDLAGGLVVLTNKVARNNFLPIDTFLDKLDEYEQKETQRLIAKGQETQAEAVADKCATLRVFADQIQFGGTTSDMIAKIRALFEDTPDGERARTLTLSTVHKAKGREWNRVYLIGRNKYMPSKWARQAWQQDQEVNLMYVAVTRAKRELVEVDV